MRQTDISQKIDNEPRGETNDPKEKRRKINKGSWNRYWFKSDGRLSEIRMNLETTMAICETNGYEIRIATKEWLGSEIEMASLNNTNNEIERATYITTTKGNSENHRGETRECKWVKIGNILFSFLCPIFGLIDFLYFKERSEIRFFLLSLQKILSPISTLYSQCPMPMPIEGAGSETYFAVYDVRVRVWHIK